MNHGRICCATDGHPPDHQFYLDKKEDVFTCAGCKEVGFGKYYSCQDPSCMRDGFHLHIGCGKCEGRRTHYLYDGCTFEFRDIGNNRKFCDACGGDVEGYFYQGYWDNRGSWWRSDRKQPDLHPSCMALKSEIRFSDSFHGEGHDISSVNSDIRDVVLVLKTKLPSGLKCLFCHLRNAHGRKTWAYVSNCKSYGYHVSCLKKFIMGKFEDLRLNRATQLPVIRVVGTETLDWMDTLFGSAVSDIFPLPPSRSGNRAAVDGLSISRINRIRIITQRLLSVIIPAIIGDPISLTIGVMNAALNN